MSSVFPVLQSLAAAIKDISGDQYCTSSKIIPLMHCMLSKINSLVIEKPLVKVMEKLILKEINGRMGAIEHVIPNAIACILDPRFKKMHFNDAKACANAVSKIKQIMMIVLKSVDQMDSDSDKSDKIEEDFSLWGDHHKLVRHTWKSNKSEGSLSDEAYLSQKSSGKIKRKYVRNLKKH